MKSLLFIRRVDNVFRVRDPLDFSTTTQINRSVLKLPLPFRRRLDKKFNTRDSLIDIFLSCFSLLHILNYIEKHVYFLFFLFCTYNNVTQ